jgi:hypothetical protein
MIEASVLAYWQWAYWQLATGKKDYQMPTGRLVLPAASWPLASWP